MLHKMSNITYTRIFCRFFFFLMQIFDPYPSSPLGSAPVLLTVPSVWVVIDSSQSEAPDINFN